ncbi:MAG: hypothetical protein ACJAVK_001526 [Akkermansiaceae bacterium]|jgi:hypothetical protein
MDRFLSGESFRRSLERSLGFWDISPFGLALEAFLDLPNAREIFVELFLIAFAQGALHAAAIDTDGVEDALTLLKAGVQFFTRIARVGEELVKKIERTLDAGDRISGVIPRKRKPLSMAGIRTAIRFVREKDEGRKAGLFPEMLCGNLVARNRVVKAFAGSARDIGSGEVGGRAAMGVTRADIGEVGHHGDIVFVPSQRRESFGHPDFGEAARFLGIKSIFGESKPSTQEDHAFGRNGGGRLGCRKGFEKWQGQDGSTKTQERATGR